jgi:hypothetical protein
MSVTIRVARWFTFKPKFQIWVNFGGSWNLEYLMVFWYILWPFGNLVYFWYILPRVCAKKNLATLVTIRSSGQFCPWYCPKYLQRWPISLTAAKNPQLMSKLKEGGPKNLLLWADVKKRFFNNLVFFGPKIFWQGYDGEARAATGLLRRWRTKDLLHLAAARCLLLCKDFQTIGPGWPDWAVFRPIDDC